LFLGVADGNRGKHNVKLLARQMAGGDSNAWLIVRSFAGDRQAAPCAPLETLL
jgi:hypothetical protein